MAVAADATKSKSKTVTVARRSTKTVIVAYADALKQGDFRYRCTATVTSGDKTRVKITKGSAEGGSVCQARIVNSSSRSATVKVAPTTIEPEQGY